MPEMKRTLEYGSIQFEIAKESDSSQILEVLEEAPFEGPVSMLYTRRPDPIHAIRDEYGDVHIVVCRDVIKNRVAGFGICAYLPVWTGGQPAVLGYLSTLRVRHAYRKTYGLIKQAYRYMQLIQEGREGTEYLTTILEDNLYAQKLLEKKRPFMPLYHPHGWYEVYALKRLPKAIAHKEYVFQNSSPKQQSRVIRWIEAEGKRYDYFPRLSMNGINNANLYHMETAAGDIVAAGSLCDMSRHKQHVVVSYQGVCRWLRGLSFLAETFGYPRVPNAGESINCLALSNWVVKDDSPHLFEPFLRHIRSKIARGKCLLIGMHEKHPLRGICRRGPHYLYRSKLYRVGMNGRNIDVSTDIHSARIPYMDCAML